MNSLTLNILPKGRSAAFENSNRMLIKIEEYIANLNSKTPILIFNMNFGKQYR